MTTRSTVPHDRSAAEPLRLAVLVGSVRQERIGLAVGRWAARRAALSPEWKVDLVDLAALPLAPDLGATAATAELATRIDDADAVLVVTCEYNHGYPASLKLAIDSLFEQWAAKPVGFVSYGGRAGGLLAVEQLRPVFAEVQAVTVRETVSLRFPHGRIDADGHLTDPDLARGAESAADQLLRQLAWWATALRDARTARPYGAHA